jgi:cell filamentation protein
MADSYVYPGTNVLINEEGIRDKAELDQFERVMTALRLREGVPEVASTTDGSRAIHRHIFQDVYHWAGEFRIVDISKGGDLFSRPQFIRGEMDKRFVLIGAEAPWSGMANEDFVRRLAGHVSELNAIHPFREGNGRTMRAFIDVAARQAGHELRVENIQPTAWTQASIDSFRMGDAAGLERVIGSISGPHAAAVPT